MTDLIERDAVIWITAETGALETQSRVKELPVVNRWIPVQERLPETDKDVLVYAVRKDGLGDSVTTITQFSCKFSFIFISDYEITHWMPLPEPPERSETQCPKLTENGSEVCRMRKLSSF